MDPARFHGGVYDATNWVRVGRTKGFARHKRGVYGRAQGAEGDVRSGTEAWGAGAVGGPGGPPGVELSGDEGVLHGGGVAVVAGVVCTDAGLPPWSGAQAPAGDGAGDLRLGAVVGVERAGGDGTVCETPEPGGVAGAGGVAGPQGGPVGGAVGLDFVPGGGGHRPGRLAGRVEPMGGASGGSDRPPAGAGRGRQTHPRRQPPYRRGRVLRDGDPGDPRRAPAGQAAAAATRGARSPQPGRCSKTWTCKAA